MKAITAALIVAALFPYVGPVFGPGCPADLEIGPTSSDQADNYGG